jgi:drug/metabolite transporter, DME family
MYVDTNDRQFAMTTAIQMTTNSNRGAWMVLAAGVLWGTTGTAQAFAPAGATPLAIGAVRLLIGGTALLILALVRRQLRPRGWPLLPTATVLAGIALYQVCFFAAVNRAGVAVGTVVAIGSAPMLAGLLGLVVLGERPTRRWMFATLLAVAGCTLLVVAGSGSTGDVHLDAIGILLALGAGAAYALYTMASRELLRVQPPDAVTAVAFFGGALLLAPLLFFVDLSWLTQPDGILVALHLGIVTTTLSYILYIRALLTVPSATAVTLALMEPLTAATLGILVLGERPTLPAMIGIAMLLAGLLVLTIRSQPQPIDAAE